MISRAFAQNMAIIGMLVTLREVKRISMYEYEGTHITNGNWWQLNDIAMLLMGNPQPRRDYKHV